MTTTLNISRDKQGRSVYFFEDPDDHKQAVVVIANKGILPAMGGIRKHPWGSIAEAAKEIGGLADAMALKTAAAEYDNDGCKIGIFGDPLATKGAARSRYFKWLGSCLTHPEICGKLVTAMDSGLLYPRDLLDVKHGGGRSAVYVASLPQAHGGSGDSSVQTAHGAVFAIEGTMQALFPGRPMSEMHCVVVGVGNVGRRVASQLYVTGCKITISDILPENIELVRKALSDINVIDDIEEALGTPCDFLIPCVKPAGFIHQGNIPDIRARVIIPVTNNVLLEPYEDSINLHGRGVSCPPDWLTNAGGLIGIKMEAAARNAWVPYDHEAALKEVSKIRERVAWTIKEAARLGEPEYTVALRRASSLISARVALMKKNKSRSI